MSQQLEFSNQREVHCECFELLFLIELGVRNFSELGIRSEELGVNSTFKTPHSTFISIKDE